MTNWNDEYKLLMSGELPPPPDKPQNNNAQWVLDGINADKERTIARKAAEVKRAESNELWLAAHNEYTTPEHAQWQTIPHNQNAVVSYAWVGWTFWLFVIGVLLYLMITL